MGVGMKAENIDELIKQLESRPETPENIKELANLYIVKDHLGA